MTKRISRFACVVFNCNMRTYSMTPEQKQLSSSEYLVAFHKFPSDLKRQKLWAKALGNEDWVPSDDSVVCSLHFGSDCYDENNKLLDTAVPSIMFDSFEDHLKLILDAIEKEKFGEIDFDDKNTCNKETMASKEGETEVFSSSDSDFEIECEEIILSDESGDENADGESSISSEHETQVTKSPRKSTKPSPSKNVPVKPVTQKTVGKPILKTTNSSASTISTPPAITTPVSFVSESPKSAAKQNAVASKTSKVPVEVTIENDVPVSDSNNSKEKTVSSKHDAVSNSVEPAIPKLHKIPIKEDTSEQARQLYSMIQSGSFQNFPVMQPASKNLVRQLLDIVKLANSGNQSASNEDDNIPNTYIITTKYDDPNSTAKVRLVETGEVISTISKTVQAIKDGSYEKSDDLVIICGSPAIFLIKNVSVKTFDPNMNSVYVITSENLISYLYLLSTKAKPPRKIPMKTTEPGPVSSASQTPQPSSTVAKTLQKNQKIPFSSLATKIIPQKVLSSTPSNSSSLTQVPSVASTSTSSLQEKSCLRPIAPATTPQNASRPIVPVISGTVCVSSVAAENTRPVQSLPLASVATKSVPLIPLGVTKNTPLSASATISTSSPIIGSSLLIANSSGATSIVIPSKSSAFQAPKMAIAPLNAMRNNMVSFKRKIDAINESNSQTPSKEASIPAKPVPSLVVTQSPAASNIISLPRAVTTALNKTGSVKLTFAPALSSISTPKTSQPLKPLQPTDGTQSLRLEANKLGLKFNTVAQKRKAADFVVIDPNPKRSVGIDKTTGNSSQLKSNVVPVAKPISPVRTESPEAPSPIPVHTVDSDSEEERPLSPRAAQRLLGNQRNQIRALQQDIIKKERDILALRKKIPALKKRCLAAKKTADSKSDEQLVEDILKKYLDNDAVQFFLGQMKMSGKTFTQFRWTEEDKLFALGLLYKNPVEYHVLVQRFTLPSDKTLNKFVSRIKRAEMEANATS